MIFNEEGFINSKIPAEEFVLTNQVCVFFGGDEGVE